MHEFLVHKRGDHVGVATSDISAKESVYEFYMGDDTRIEISSKTAVPLGHKIAVEELEAGGPLIAPRRPYPTAGCPEDRTRHLFKPRLRTADNPFVEGRGTTRRRSRAGLSTLRRHRKEMMGP